MRDPDTQQVFLETGPVLLSVNPDRMNAQSVKQLIEQMFEEQGALRYGENVTQLEHALQCASLAHMAGAGSALVMAALLHDIGHMVHDDAAAAFRNARDDHHEALGAKWLKRYFIDAVAQPVAWHVQAKRYLCLRETGYWDALSAVSKQTLVLQGGPMNQTEAEWFEQQAYMPDAVMIRRWDDAGKREDAEVLSLQHFLDLVPQVIAPTVDGTSGPL
jgi:[1-hydroxy-2-(trimethylamino)ethyl]phosphonate dioxygenase